MAVLKTGLKKIYGRYLAPIPADISATDVAIEMLGLLKFFVIGGLIVLATTLKQGAPVLDIGFLLAIMAGFIVSWMWWAKNVRLGKNLVAAALSFAFISLAAFIVANNPMGLMLIWSATAVIYLSFSPKLAFLYCMVPVLLTMAIHLIGGSSINRVIMETTVAMLLVFAGFQICVSVRETSAASVESAQANANLRRVNAELSTALRQSRDLTLEKERSRIAASLHDNLGHRLITVMMGLEYALRMKHREPDKAWSEVGESRDNVSEALEEMRVVVRALHPVRLNGESLSEHLNALAGSFRSTRLAVNTNIAEVQLDSQAEELVVAVTQDALTNVVRHSSATQIELELASHLDEIELKIADDGTGTSEPFGFGLRSLAERVEQSGGLMRAEAHGGIGEGFALAVHLPRKNVDGYTNYSYR